MNKFNGITDYCSAPTVRVLYRSIYLSLSMVLGFVPLASAQIYVDTASKTEVIGNEGASIELESRNEFAATKYIGSFGFDIGWTRLDGPAGVGTRSSRRWCSLKLFSDEGGSITGGGTCTYDPGYCGPLTTSVSAQVAVNSGVATLNTTNTSGTKTCSDPVSGWTSTISVGVVNRYQFSLANNSVALQPNYCYLTVNDVCVTPASFSNTYVPACTKSNALAGEPLSDCDFKPYFGRGSNDPVYNANLSHLLARASVDAYSDTQSSQSALPQAGFNIPVMVNDTTVPGTMTAIVAEKNAAIDGESKRVLVIAFRGTQELPGDALTDIDGKMVPFSSTDSSITVHRGFKRATDAFVAKEGSTYMRTSGLSLATILQNAKAEGTQIVLTGHSLGGAMATLYGASLIDRQLVNRENLQIYTYGAPPVGNSHFVYSFFDGERSRRLNLFRVRNQADPVTYSASLASLYKYASDAIDAAVASDWTRLSAELYSELKDIRKFVAKLAVATAEMYARELFEARPMQHLGFETVFLESGGVYTDITYSFDEISIFNQLYRDPDVPLNASAHFKEKYVGFTQSKLGDPTTAFSVRLLPLGGSVLSSANVYVGMRLRESDVGVPLQFYAALVGANSFSSISGFNQVTPSALVPFVTKTLTSASASLNLLGGYDLTPYKGSILLVGYGRSYDEMVRNRTYRYLSIVN